MLFRIESENKKLSCGTYAMEPRRTDSGTVSIGWPETEIASTGGFHIRIRRLISVDFPEPVAPIMASVPPVSKWKEMFFKTSFSVPG